MPVSGRLQLLHLSLILGLSCAPARKLQTSKNLINHPLQNLNDFNQYSAHGIVMREVAVESSCGSCTA